MLRFGANPKSMSYRWTKMITLAKLARTNKKQKEKQVIIPNDDSYTDDKDDDRPEAVGVGESNEKEDGVDDATGWTKKYPLQVLTPTLCLKMNSKNKLQEVLMLKS
jgi:hypothetical protein